MTRTELRWTLGMLALVIAAAAAWWVPAPEMAARPTCECEGSYQTNEDWGYGSNCSLASQDLDSNLLARAEDRCGAGNVCGVALVITTACKEYPAGSGQYMIDGYYAHGCCAGWM